MRTHQKTFQLPANAPILFEVLHMDGKRYLRAVVAWRGQNCSMTRQWHQGTSLGQFKADTKDFMLSVTSWVWNA